MHGLAARRAAKRDLRGLIAAELGAIACGLAIATFVIL
jgi:hypothetical protein